MLIHLSDRLSNVNTEMVFSPLCVWLIYYYTNVLKSYIYFFYNILWMFETATIAKWNKCWKRNTTYGSHDSIHIWSQWESMVDSSFFFFFLENVYSLAMSSTYRETVLHIIDIFYETMVDRRNTGTWSVKLISGTKLHDLYN